MTPLRAIPALLAALACVTATATACPASESLLTDTHPPAPAAPAVDVDQAGQQLAGLTVAPEGSDAGYSREKFPHWTTITPGCTTREVVLGEQGQGVRDDDGDCYPDAGMWISPYDGAVWTRASDLDIDHLVPLAEAWRSGAAGWTTVRRRDFANDLTPGNGYPQLVAVTDNVNQSKGDRDVDGQDGYRPLLVSAWCPYAAGWVDVKHRWGLAAEAAEVAALDRMLDTCGGAR